MTRWKWSRGVCHRRHYAASGRTNMTSTKSEMTIHTCVSPQETKPLDHCFSEINDSMNKKIKIKIITNNSWLTDLLLLCRDSQVLGQRNQQLTLLSHSVFVTKRKRFWLCSDLSWQEIRILFALNHPLSPLFCCFFYCQMYRILHTKIANVDCNTRQKIERYHSTSKTSPNSRKDE